MTILCMESEERWTARVYVNTNVLKAPVQSSEELSISFIAG